MKRWLYRYRSVSGDYHALADRLRADLRALLIAGTDSPRATPAGDGSFRVHLPAEVLGAELSKVVRVTTGVAASSITRLQLPIAWTAEPARHAFPAFEGTIELERLGRVHSQLIIVGSYELPASVLGVMLDQTVLSGVAERTADAILDGLTRALSAPEVAAPSPPAVDAPMRVADVMTPDPLVLADNQLVRTAALLLFNFDIAGAPVVDSHGALVGVLSEADLLDKEAAVPRFGLGRGVQEARRRRDALTVGQACTRPARVTAADTTLHDAARELVDHDIARLVVVDAGRIAGVVTRHDVLRALLRSDNATRLAIQALINRLGEGGVVVTVEWGAVVLSGTVSRLSRINHVVTQVRAIDGVMDVDAEDLGWRVDDVTPMTTPTM